MAAQIGNSLKQVLDISQKIKQLTNKGIDYLYEDETRWYAAERMIEIFGEALNRIPKDFQDEYPIDLWRGSKSIRNLISHEYDEIDYEEIWKAMTEDIPRSMPK
jgi:uncharacterized protein with HEPN domain